MPALIRRAVAMPSQAQELVHHVHRLWPQYQECIKNYSAACMSGASICIPSGTNQRKSIVTFLVSFLIFNAAHLHCLCLSYITVGAIFLDLVIFIFLPILGEAPWIPLCLTIVHIGIPAFTNRNTCLESETETAKREEAPLLPIPNAPKETEKHAAQEAHQQEGIGRGCVGGGSSGSSGSGKSKSQTSEGSQSSAQSSAQQSSIASTISLHADTLIPGPNYEHGFHDLYRSIDRNWSSETGDMRVLGQTSVPWRLSEDLGNAVAGGRRPLAENARRPSNTSSEGGSQDVDGATLVDTPEEDALRGIGGWDTPDAS